MPDAPASYPLRVGRYLSLFLLLLLGLLISLVSFGWLSLEARAQVASRWFHWVLRGLGVRLVVTGQTALPGRPVLFVSNHISWLDIPVFGAARPVRFVSKDDVLHWPVLGWLARRAGTLFLDRASGRAAHRLTTTIAEAIGSGERVIIFPEGTTTDGRSLLPFRPMLLQSAVDAGACVVPVSLHYLDAAGRLTPAAAFTGEMNFTDTLANIVAVRGLVAAVEFHTPIDSRGLDRAELARRTEQAARSALEARLAAG